MRMANLIPRHVLVQALPEDSLPQLEAWLREKKGAAVTLATPKRGEKHELVAPGRQERCGCAGKAQCPGGHSAGHAP